MSGASALGGAVLAEVRAALVAGASPSAALLAGADRPPGPPGRHDELRSLAAALRTGQTLAEAARDVDTGNVAADLLVRALGVAELAGAGSTAAVDQAIAAARDEAALARLLASRTLQARGTAVVLSAVPVLAWVLLVAADRTALGYYATAAGAATGGAALLLAAAGQWWSRRLLASAARAGVDADPLTPRRARHDPARLVAVGGVVFALVGVLGGGAAVGVAAAAGAVGVCVVRSRSPRRRPDRAGGAAEAVELVAVALSAGLSATAAVEVVAPLAPPAARDPLARAGRRLHAGWAPDDAFADAGLHALGATLAATERWGAPAAPALQRLAEDLRAERRAAVESAAERIQLTLIFPMTLLTLPAFVLGVVPPLLWTAFTG